MKIRILLLLTFCLNPLLVQAVDMDLPRLGGGNDRLSDYNGKWVVVNYWATWCPPCREEMPELQAFHDEHHETKGVVLGINTEVLSHDAIQAFLEDYFITYPNYATGPTSSSELGDIPGLPTTFLVSPEGQVEARQVGAVTREMIENFIKKWEAKHSQ
ncbi:MAG: TlpA disulfide reductase family protein [Gammaproteobacteria bacterium]|nr:TlpA disulfide reductase family protein [Gammaproteobacteria bacterium]